MKYQLKAEYEFRAVLAWHVVPQGAARSLCGQPLAPSAHARPLDDLAITRQVCPACRGALTLTGGRTLSADRG